MTKANTIPQKFHAGDRVRYHTGQVGVVVGDIFWGPNDHRFIVVFDQGGQGECMSCLLTRL